ncbi:hypothetical protein RIF29_06618 [Crotalaria pallida]|uniref:DNA mismatch repair protein MutS-like N-terminal domain-containing protein n=1 Tax=Crotalaria pallida TaxID=3830 RepID=A0AAN9J3P2_CROPI
MNRQKSILSFFHKTEPPTDTPGGRRPPDSSLHRDVTAASRPRSSDDDVRGTDTPPEKVPRQVLPASFAPIENDVFESIMHKFIKLDDSESVTRRSQPSNDGLPKSYVSSGICNDTNRKGSQKEEAPFHFQPIVKDSAVNFKEKAIQERVSRRSDNDGLPNSYSSLGIFNDANRKVLPKEEGAFQFQPMVRGNAINFKEKANQKNVVPVETEDDITGPETPGMQSLASHAKRGREDGSKFRSLMDSGKRVRFLEDFTEMNMTKKEAEVASKFEWLDPSRIRDANGRRPTDPLYDRTTLYIPPEILKKMTASQKQYWSVKCKYMDVVLFFKVGKFYELYEIDAEIGHKELDWKMTLSGVGKCRQVGISESGIDDAVQNLVARGYKVGRVEQLETSEEAKARGANSEPPTGVAARKLSRTCYCLLEMFLS